MLTANIQTTENSQTMESEDLNQDRYTLMEALMTFEVGTESSMFKILSDDE